MTSSKNHTTRFVRKSLYKRVLISLKRYMTKGHIRYGDNLIILGKRPILKTPRNGKVVLGNNVILNSDFVSSNTSLTTRVKFVTGYDGIIQIGNNCDLNGVCIVAYDKVEIGNYCQFASSTLITDTDFHSVDSSQRLKQMKGYSFDFKEIAKKPISIGNNTWIGWGCIILKGVTIGNNCVVAAGSVVVGNSVFPDNSIIAGNPAKVVKTIK